MSPASSSRAVGRKRSVLGITWRRFAALQLAAIVAVHFITKIGEGFHLWS